MKKYFLVIFAALFLTLDLWAVEVTEDDFRDVAGQLRCPTCQGMSVLESDAAFSNQIKDLVREKMSQGMSQKEIEAFFVERYGPWILREPPKQGFHLTAWLIPIGLLVLGPILLWFLMWRRTPVEAAIKLRSDADIMAEMEKVLRKMKEGGHAV